MGCRRLVPLAFDLSLAPYPTVAVSPEAVRLSVQDHSEQACKEINAFSKETLRTRGQRMGSGMGTLLEALWGYYMNRLLARSGEGAAAYELVWLEHQYNDFACIPRDSDWSGEDRTTELFRIEAKTMNLDADEAKGHFDEIQENLWANDLLLVLLWRWETIDEHRYSPIITDHFLDRALPVAKLRDALHLTRGGSFVDQAVCPDNHPAAGCTHHGEPLNERGKRERPTGPEVSRVSANVSAASNFGGLVRMLKTKGDDARAVFDEIRGEDDVAHDYVSFIHRHLPKEEENQYGVAVWRELAERLSLNPKGKKQEVIERVRAAASDGSYREIVRKLNSAGPSL